MKSHFLIKAALGGILLTFLNWGMNLIAGISLDASNYGWGLLANFLVVSILGFLIIHSAHRGFLLIAIVFAVYFLIGNFNLLIEAWIFNVTDRTETEGEVLRGLLAAAIFAPILVYWFREEKRGSALKFVPRSYLNWVGKVILADFLYLVFYLIAGMILYAFYPPLMEFYEDKIPPFGLMIQTQLFIRGLIFAGIAILILRTTKQTLVIKAVLIGLVFAIIGGVAPLIPPSDFMPGNIRLGHGVEVGISNFLYGLTIAYFLKQKPQEETEEEVAGKEKKEVTIGSAMPLE